MVGRGGSGHRSGGMRAGDGGQGVRLGGPYIEERGRHVGHAWNTWAGRGEGKRAGPEGTRGYSIYSNKFI
jgi:hypothetical protein